ncbi:auxin-repressed 12.5 kDa protein-like [Macadamia integrifolia]|uniref:auxin-repressed 12.5 kDa protein-like n=1 Tax=Macadamia integrifolia TaxID=60698 RepID=UPI001C4E7CAE|nr:auxin-repressed 12.5 kDa protein-like [Macadamia integrifolia]
MVLVENFWDEVLAGPHPDQGMRMITAKPLNLKRCIYEGEGSKLLSIPESPMTPFDLVGSGHELTPLTPAALVTPLSAKKENVWRSVCWGFFTIDVFNPGRNLAIKGIGVALFDKPKHNTPTVYDWLYSDDTRSKHR